MTLTKRRRDCCTTYYTVYELVLYLCYSIEKSPFRFVVVNVGQNIKKKYFRSFR